MISIQTFDTIGSGFDIYLEESKIESTLTNGLPDVSRSLVDTRKPILIKTTQTYCGMGNLAGCSAAATWGWAILWFFIVAAILAVIILSYIQRDKIMQF